jgi:2-amino-4-hydroxy-6-hydroxymethyldihydropteridine diphosphokinase
MILIALGSNVPGPWGSSSATVRKAIRCLDTGGCRLVKFSSLLVSAPLGKTNQPNFVNAAARIATGMSPEALLAHLQRLEALAGREPGERWGPRVLDLDLIDFNGLIRDAPPPMLPHPGIQDRAFVLAPIAEIAPRWRHPVLGQTAAELLKRLEGQAEGAVIRRLQGR